MNIVTLDKTYAVYDDCQLVLACQERSEAAFNELYKRYHSYVRTVVRRLAPDLPQIYDDIVQEVFLRVWRSVNTLRDVRAFKKWLSRLITNVFYNELRKRPKEFVISTDDYLRCTNDRDDPEGIDLVDTRPQPDELTERKEAMFHVNEALKSLPDLYKNVFLMREYYGLPYHEIALRADIELGTVKSRLSRARGKLQFLLQPLICA